MLDNIYCFTHVDPFLASLKRGQLGDKDDLFDDPSPLDVCSFPLLPLAVTL